MKILYGIQGTGHGHISRAKVLLPKLRERAEVDIMISGYNYNLDLGTEISYKARGISFSYDSKGSIDFLDTALKFKPVRMIKDIQAIPVTDYDMVVNDFEPISAWAASAASVPCVAISHQVSFLSDKCPRPEKTSKLAEQVFKYFAPGTGAVGSHYRRYDDFIEPPIVRRQIRDLNAYHGGHITVYLPAFDHQTLCSVFSQIREVSWHIFSPSCEENYINGNVKVSPPGNDSFLESIEGCCGIISAAGFETTSEAMYLNKKLLVLPIRNQYEQLCNAAALQTLGGEVVERIDGEFIAKVRHWLSEGKLLSLPEISDADDLAAKILKAGSKSAEPVTN